MELNKLRIIVIIVTFNAMKWIDKCIGSIKGSDIPVDIIIIDNGSTDGTKEYIKGKYKEVIYYESEENLGFGKANNIGIQYAKDHNYDYVYLLNQDAWLFPKTLSTLIKHSLNNPEYGVFSPMQMDASTTKFDKNFKALISRTDIIDDLYCNKVKSIYEIPYIMAAHWLITKDCYLKVGGFSPSFPHYGEDNNYCYRATFHGFKIGVIPSAIAVHDRAIRPEPIEKKIYIRAYIKAINYLSNINHRISFLQIFTDCFLASIFKYKRIPKLSYFMKLVRDYNRIMINRKLSFNDGSFLK